MGGFEKAGHVRRGVGSHEPVGAAVVNAHLLQSAEIAQQLLPFRREAGLAREVVEMLLHRQRSPGARPGQGGYRDLLQVDIDQSPGSRH